MLIQRLLFMCSVFVALFLAATVSVAGSDPEANPDDGIRQLPFEKVNIDQFTTETQLGTPDPDRLLFIWWIPSEFWEVIYSQDEDMSEAETEEIVGLLDPYIVIAVVDAQLGVFGNATYRSLSDLKKAVRLIDKQGKQVRAIPPKDVDGDVQILLNAMKPILTNLIGPMGEHMYFFVFPSESRGQEIIGSCAEIGRLTVAIDGERYYYHTPLPSMIEEKHCGVCERQFRGDYKVCPYDSERLQYK